jgi:hypothetical protein
MGVEMRKGGERERGSLPHGRGKSREIWRLQPIGIRAVSFAKPPT